jgi:biotin carboxyl carrier protein
MGLDLKANKKVEPVKAPMPGMVLKVLVRPGQQIEKGDGLLILEAMKMENVLKANGPATVKSIRVEERTAVEKGAVLIDLE